jgi:tRNA (guanosine-2'-O-)-methyltransferase
MVSERRLERMTDVLAQRLVHVRCAIEAVHHRHNVSAILRTCDSLGVHRVDLVSSERFKVSPGAARGAERWLDLTKHDDPTVAIRAIQAEGYRVYVADLSDDAVEPRGIPLDRPCCLWFGAEHAGVSPEATAAADGVVMLPMRGFAQSLNVSVAAALILSQVADRSRSLHSALLSEADQQATLQAWLAREKVIESRIARRQNLGRTLP